MKIKSFRRVIPGVAIGILCLMQGGTPQTLNLHAQPAPPPDAGAAAAPALAPDIDPNSPLAEVIKLVQAGVDESVILNYIANSPATFNLDSNQIIYLQDIGVSSNVMNGMMQRDQQLRAQMSDAGTVAPTQPPPPPTTETVAYEQPAQPTVVNVNYFYDTLTPYGSWVEVEGYGWCWQPTVVVVDTGWQPYCDRGHWVYTDCGWYWMSDYSWGWATFHYGRWFHHPRFGWCWWPDTVWAPSWVCWRSAPGYCGWAPLPPYTCWQSGVGFVYRGSTVSVGFDFGLSVGAFTFVAIGDFCDPRPWHHRIGHDQVTQIYNHTTIINNINVDSHNHTIINNGIPPHDITAVTHQEIHPVTIHDTGRPGVHGQHGEQLEHGGHTLAVNRPHFTENVTPVQTGPTPPAQHFRPTPHPAPNRNTLSPAPSAGGNPNVIPPEVGRPASGRPPGQGTVAQPAYHRVTPPQTTTGNYNNDNQTVTPKAQQIERQSPHSAPFNSKPNQNATAPAWTQPATPPPATHYSPPPAPAERPQYNSPRIDNPPHNESRPNYSPPPPRSAPPSAPPPSTPPAQSSGKSDRQDNNQGGQGGDDSQGGSKGHNH